MATGATIAKVRETEFALPNLRQVAFPESFGLAISWKAGVDRNESQVEWLGSVSRCFAGSTVESRL